HQYPPSPWCRSVRSLRDGSCLSPGIGTRNRHLAKRVFLGLENIVEASHGVEDEGPLRRFSRRPQETDTERLIAASAPLTVPRNLGRVLVGDSVPVAQRLDCFGHGFSRIGSPLYRFSSTG